MKPAVSVITVCRNACGDLRKTGESLFRQSSKAFEWIVVDGASSDGTLDYLKGLEQSSISWISEPDSGIYDAMNKGLKLARGERVWFMNAGDTFFDSESLTKVVDASAATDVCFGEVEVTGPDGSALGTRSSVTPHQLPVHLEYSLFKYGMIVSHQAFVVKRSLAPFYRADRYCLSADLDWMLEILQEQRTTDNLGLIARIQREGATMDNWVRSQSERFLILGRHFGFGRTLVNHLLIVVRRIRHAMRTRLWR